MNKIDNKSLISSLSITYIAQFFTLVSQVVLIKLLIFYLSKNDFGAFMVIKRYISAIWPLLTLNLSISMSRNISFIKKGRSLDYLLFTISIVSLFFIIYTSITLIFKNRFTSLLFGNEEYYFLIYPLTLYLYANCLQTIFRGYFRGKHNFIWMNLSKMLFWVFQVIILIFLNIFFKNSKQLLYQFLVIFSALTIAIVFIYVVAQIIKNFNRIKIKQIINIFRNKKNLVKYGIIRLPKVFFMAVTYFIPVFYASNRLSLKSAAYISCIIAYIRIFKILGNPFNQILLPVFSKKKSDNNYSLIKKNSKMIIEFIFTLPAFIGASAYFFSNEAILLWFGKEYSSIIPIASAVSPVVMFLLVSVIIQGVLDGLFEFPYFNIISFYSFIIILLGILFVEILSLGIYGLAISLGAGIFFSGLLSIYYLAKTQNCKLFNKNNIISIFWFILILAIFYIFNNTVNIDNLYTRLVLKILITAIIFIISILVYAKNSHSWIEKIIDRYHITNWIKKFV